MSIDTTPATRSPTSGRWARTFAATYDPFLWAAERSGARSLRSDLLAGASGLTVEVGAGTGLNLAHYPEDLTELHLAEPDPAMRARLARALSTHARSAQIVDAPAEYLPFADASVDTVVSTFVLCTVDAPDLALREIRRVLRSDGQLLLIEHVRSESPMLAGWQDRLAGPWRRFAQGCRCNRATTELLADHGFALDDLHGATWRAMPPIVRPLVAGRTRIARVDA